METTMTTLLRLTRRVSDRFDGPLWVNFDLVVSMQRVGQTTDLCFAAAAPGGGLAGFSMAETPDDHRDRRDHPAAVGARLERRAMGVSMMSGLALAISPDLDPLDVLDGRVVDVDLAVGRYVHEDVAALAGAVAREAQGAAEPSDHRRIEIS
jgi:hypothetical protein